MLIIFVAPASITCAKIHTIHCFLMPPLLWSCSDLFQSWLPGQHEPRGPSIFLPVPSSYSQLVIAIVILMTNNTISKYLHISYSNRCSSKELLWCVHRPLMGAMLKYAREDTHYLLYIYDCMKNDLLHRDNGQTSLLLSAFQKSNHLCMKVR